LESAVATGLQSANRTIYPFDCRGFLGEWILLKPDRLIRFGHDMSVPSHNEYVNDNSWLYIPNDQNIPAFLT
jgi:hypothetical protein